MMTRFTLPGLALVFLLCGCTVPKKISRKYELTQVEWAYPRGQLDGNPSVKDGYSGKLQPVYERKLRGSVDGAMVINNDVITVKTTRSRVLVYGREKGNRLAQIKKPGGISADPLVIDSLLLIYRLEDGGRLELINLFTGETVARKPVRDIRGGPILIGETVVYGGIQRVSAYTIPDLNQAWSDSVEGTVLSAPVFADDILYLSTDRGTIQALTYPEREILWTRELSAPVTSGLTVATYLYAGTAEGDLVAMDRKTGELIWSYATGYALRGGMAERDSVVCFGTGSGKVYGLAVPSGSVLWEFATDGIVTAAPLIVGSAVIVGSHDRTLYSLDLITGRLIDKKRLDGPVTATAAAVDDRIYVASGKERLYCFR
jgi:hypothetical protein